MTALRLAFVTPPTASAFMADLLAAVEDAVQRLELPDVTTLRHSGFVSDVLDEQTVAVIVPHEYVAVARAEAPLVYARTIGFGVEHPGTATFTASVRASAALGGRSEISAESVAILGRYGLDAEHFVLGATPAWRGEQSADRDIDVLYLGTADERRCGILAANAEHLAAVRSELLLPPHEPMTRERPDFLLSEAKWSLLGRSKLLVNLHRESKTSLEIVRVLEAIVNGCVVLTEPSTELGPFIPGEHLLVAEPSEIGVVARAAVAHPDRLARMAEAALAAAEASLPMAPSATRLVSLARRLLTERPGALPDSEVPTTPPIPQPGEGPLAMWIPGRRFPAPDAANPSVAAKLAELGELVTEQTRANRPASPDAQPPAAVTLDVICVQAQGDRMWRWTAASLGPDAQQRLLVAAVGESSERDVLALHPAVPRGAARNLLIEGGESPYLAILDAGDQVLGDFLKRAVAALAEDPELEVVLSLGRGPDGELTNGLIPESRRLAQGPYLGAGYVVRRSFLADLGGFSEDPYLDELVDHDFWLRATDAGAKVRLLRNFGVEFSAHASDGPSAWDAAEVARRVAERLTGPEWAME